MEKQLKIFATVIVALFIIVMIFIFYLMLTRGKKDKSPEKLITELSIDTAMYQPGSETYPGVKPGEVFLTLISFKNYQPDEGDTWEIREITHKKVLSNNLAKFKNYKSLRVGIEENAYFIFGTQAKGYYPLYISKYEWIKK